jgi:hypothetical protein
VFEKKVSKRILASKRKKVTRGQRKVLNEELHNLYSSTKSLGYYYDDEIKMERWKGHGRNENCIQNIGRKS